MPEYCGVTALINVLHAPNLGPRAGNFIKKNKNKIKLHSLSTPDMSPEACEQKGVLKHG